VQRCRDRTGGKRRTETYADIDRDSGKGCADGVYPAALQVAADGRTDELALFNGELGKA